MPILHVKKLSSKKSPSPPFYYKERRERDFERIHINSRQSQLFIIDNDKDIDNI